MVAINAEKIYRFEVGVSKSRIFAMRGFGVTFFVDSEETKYPEKAIFSTMQRNINLCMFRAESLVIINFF